MTTLTILLCVVTLEVIYLHYRQNKHKEEISDIMDILQMDVVDLRYEMIQLSRKIDEKPRRRSTKRSRKVSKVEVPKSKILRKSRGNKNLLQTGGKG